MTDQKHNENKCSDSGLEVRLDVLLGYNEIPTDLPTDRPGHGEVFLGISDPYLHNICII